MNCLEVHYGDIWFVELSNRMLGYDNGVQTGCRPCVVVSNEKCNENSPSVSVVPLTSNLNKKPIPTHCVIKSAPYESIALCEQVTCVDKESFVRKCGSLNASEIRNVKIRIMVQLGLI